MGGVRDAVIWTDSRRHRADGIIRSGERFPCSPCDWMPQRYQRVYRTRASGNLGPVALSKADSKSKASSLKTERDRTLPVSVKTEVCIFRLAWNHGCATVLGWKFAVPVGGHATELIEVRSSSRSQIGPEKCELRCCFDCLPCLPVCAAPAVPRAACCGCV